MVELARIVPDPDFENLRLPPTDEEVQLRADSMRREGMKVPVTLVESSVPRDDGPWYHVRAGFRREKAARLLGWRRVPAVILPRNTPVVDEYWVNVIENSARTKLSSYEVAHAARAMREKFGTSAREFALRAGYSEPYVGNLLRCIDRLPPEVMQVWREQAPIPVDMYVKWSSLTPTEACRAMLTYTGRNPKVVGAWRPPPEVRERVRKLQMASSAGLARMQRLRLAVEVTRELSEDERTLCLQVVDFCSGAREDVPRVYAPEKRKREPDTEPPPPDDLADLSLPDKKED